MILWEIVKKNTHSQRKQNLFQTVINFKHVSLSLFLCYCQLLMFVAFNALALNIIFTIFYTFVYTFITCQCSLQTHCLFFYFLFLFIIFRACCLFLICYCCSFSSNWIIFKIALCVHCRFYLWPIISFMDIYKFEDNKKNVHESQNK